MFVCNVLLLMGPMMLFGLGSPLKKKNLLVFLVFVFTDSSEVLYWIFDCQVLVHIIINLDNVCGNMGEGLFPTSVKSVTLVMIII